MSTRNSRRKKNNRRNKKNRNNTRRYGKNMMMQGAPAGVSQDLQQFTRFLPSNGGNGFIMHTCAPIVQIYKETNAATIPAAIAPLSGDEGVSLQLNLTHPARLTTSGTKTLEDYISPVWDLIASAFVRFRIRKLVFHYEPQASATDSQRLVFAFAADPMHPVLWNATPPGAGDLLALADSIAFMPWRSWSMNVTEKLSADLFYTYSDPSTTTGDFPERFSDFGVISCLTSVAGAAADLIGGVLYMESEIEFTEFCPISVTRPSSKLMIDDMRKRKTLKGKQPEMENKNKSSSYVSFHPKGCRCSTCSL